MNWTSVGDVSAFVAIIAFVITAASWLIRRWYRSWKHFVVDSITSQLDEKVIPHITNGEVSVAHYAHDARDAAQAAGEASIRAERAALNSEAAAMKTSLTAERIEMIVKHIDAKLEGKDNEKGN